MRCCASSSPIPDVKDPFRLNLRRMLLGMRYGSISEGREAKETVERRRRLGAIMEPGWLKAGWLMAEWLMAIWRSSEYGSSRS